MKKSVLMALLSGAALLGLAATADAKVISLKVTSSGPAQTSSASFATPDFTLSKAGTMNSVVYAIQGISHEGSDLIYLSLNTTSHNTVNTVKNVVYSVTVTGLTAQ